MRIRWAFISVLVVVSSLAAQNPPATPAKPDQKIPVHEETVVVTGSFEPVALEDSDRAVTVIEPGEAPVLLGNYADYLRQEPSVDLRQRAPGVQADVSIRGSSFGQTLVLLNGLRLNDSQTGHHNMDLPIPLESLSRVEVLRGSGSTLYGSDAVGGAVNFITAAPSTTELRASSGIGNFGVNEQRADFSYGGSRWSEQLSGERDFSSGFRPDRDYRSMSLASNTRFASALGTTSVLLAGADRPFGADQFYGNYPSFERTKSWFSALSQDLGSKTLFAIAYRRHSDVFSLYRYNPSVYTNNHVTESWQTALRRHDTLGKRATLSYGGEGYHDGIDSSNLGQHDRSRAAGYANIDARWKRLSLSAGAREEVYASDKAEFSPTASVGTWISQRVKVRAAVSRAFRLPTYTDLYYRDPASVGDPNLKPESAWSYEGGAEWMIASNAVADVTVFHRREQNGIDYVKRFPTDVWRATNIQNLNFTGVEASVRLTVAKVHRIDFAYTALTGAQDALGGLVSRYVFNYPTNSGSVSWQGMLPGKIVARSRVGVLERYKRDVYPLFDAGVTRDFGRVRPFVRFANLSDEKYEEIPGVMMPGRSVVGGVELVLFRREK